MDRVFAGQTVWHENGKRSHSSRGGSRHDRVFCQANAVVVEGRRADVSMARCHPGTVTGSGRGEPSHLSRRVHGHFGRGGGGSIAGLMPGTYQAVYNGTKASLYNFAFALRAELKDSGVTVTCPMPGATGFKAMMKGAGEIVTGWNNKLRAAISHILPAGVLAEQHRREAAPGTAERRARAWRRRRRHTA